MEEMNGAEAQEQAVTEEGVEAPINSEESSPSLEQGEEGSEAKQEEMISRAEFNKRVSNLRAESERKYQKQLRERLQQELQQYEGPIKLHMALQQDPEKARIIAQILSGQAPQQAQEQDPFAEFDPVIAQELRDVRELKQWRQAIEQERQAERQAWEQQITQQIQSGADEAFDSLLQKDGYLKDDGTPYDENEVDFIQRAAIPHLLDIAQNPYRPTKEEMRAVYDQTMAGLKALMKRSRSKTISQTPHIPTSGSKNGAVPGGNKKINPAESWKLLAGAME